MRLLLDTHALLWHLANSGRLSAAARAAIADPQNQRWLSPVSLIEIALKNRVGRLPLPFPFATLFPAYLVAEDIHLLPLEPQHIEPLTRLPFLHRDPFDRLLAATGLVEGLTLVSADAAFDGYGVARLW